MKPRTAALIGVWFLLVSLHGLAVSSAHADSNSDVQQLTVRNAIGLPATRVAAAERVVALQVNTQLDRYWTSQPHVRFTASGGWPITLVRGIGLLGKSECGYHGPQAPWFGLPYAVVSVNNHCDNWTIGLSHEVMEMVVDPLPGTYQINGQWPEVSDPVNADSYNMRDVVVSDFVTPSYFWRAPGVWDQMRLLAR